MKKKELFFGAATALVTPFADGKIDREAFLKLIDYQVSSGIDALVIGGTTAEAATLSDAERYSLFELAKERCGGRVKLIFGTGTNDTSLAIKHTVMAEKIGCDGVLAVTPYYNKGTKDGIAGHYLSIANSTNLPIILYNVPSRTGVNLDFDILERLSREENIVGIKEAADSAERLVCLAGFGEELRLYAGNDSAIYSVLALGGSGVISVASNVLPREIGAICRLYKEGRSGDALSIQLGLLPFIRALFIETNPAPIKYVMSKRYGRLSSPIIGGELRLPLSEVQTESKKIIDSRVEEIPRFTF